MLKVVKKVAQFESNSVSNSISSWAKMRSCAKSHFRDCDEYNKEIWTDGQTMLNRAKSDFESIGIIKDTFISNSSECCTPLLKFVP